MLTDDSTRSDNSPALYPINVDSLIRVARRPVAVPTNTEESEDALLPAYVPTNVLLVPACGLEAPA